MGILDSFKPKKSIDELEEETERLDAEDREVEKELSIAEKRVAIARLKESGLTPGHFNFDWKKILAWIKAH